MAELPELGEHCFLKVCNRLDYTPFRCTKCTNFYCVDHRFNHDCQKLKTSEESAAKLEGTAAKQFLCSLQQCFAREFVRLDCSQCNKNYCMKHRLCEEHNCESMKSAKAEVPFISDSSFKKQAPIATLNKILADPVQRARADKVTIIKLKMKNTLRIPPEEQWFLLVSIENGLDDRFPVMVSKSWSIGKVVDTIKKQLNLEDAKVRNIMKMPRKDGDKALPFSDSAAKHLTDMTEIVVCGER